jgi:hypothetical protein
MAATQNIRLTLPAAMADEFERVRRAEKRTASDLVQEAVRSYLSFLRRFPETDATRTELRAICQGRRAFARGEYIGLDKLLHKVEPGRNQTRRKKPKQVSRKG